MSQVVILKTITGEEVIAKKIGTRLYEKARVFRMMSDDQGRPQAGLVPFIMVAPDVTITINDSLIMTEIDCPVEIERSYLEATTDFVLARA